MEISKHKNFSLRIIAILMVFFIAISPFAHIKRVKAEAATLALIGGTAIVALILSALASQNSISGDYTVSAPDLTAITEKAQANLQAAGANAVEQANRLGEAIKSGAESAKIKALASGAVIYAFLSAMQDTLFPGFDVSGKPDFEKPGYKMFYSPTYGPVSVSSSVLDLTVNNIFGDWVVGRWNNRKDLLAKPMSLGSSSRRIILSMYRYRNGIGNGSIVSTFSDYQGAEKMATMRVDPGLEGLLNGPIYEEPVTKIASAPSVTIPTVLPSSVSNNINNWDGTSDLVLAPPLPYDIPTGEDLVIDPSYVGEGTVDPPTPTTDPDNPPSEEEGITLPWLAALLGLLGLGQLTGIDEGVKSGIDNLVDSISNTAQDVYDGVRDWADTARSTIAQGIEGVRAKLGEIAGVITGGLALGIENIQSALGSIAETIGHAFDPPSKNVDWDKLKNIQLFNKFPFSIPSDLYYLFGLVAADPVAPCVKIPFDMTFLGGENIDATVDLATYDNVAAIIRSFEFIAFVIGMLYLTKSLIWK